MQKFSKKFKTGASAVAVLVVLFGVYGFRKMQALAADPVGEKDCRPAADGGEQGKIDLDRIKAIAPLAGVKWSQLGGSINDASCLNRTEIYGVVEVHSIDDIAKTLAFARDNKLSITTAGVRHSMGGQAFRKGGVVLDMRAFNRIVLNENARSVTVQPGATWHDIQNALHPRFAVRAMQSTDIFSRRRLDLGQCPRHGPSGRRAGQIDQIDAGDAGGRLAQDGIADREQGIVRSRGRRLRPVRRHRRGRTRYRRQSGLSDRPARAGLQGISGAVCRRDREGQQYRPDVWPPLDRAEHVPEGIAALYLHQGRRRRLQARAARRSQRRQTAAAHHQSREAGPAVPGSKVVVRKACRAPDGNLHRDARAGDRLGGGLLRQPQRSDARFGALSAQRAARRYRYPARIFHSAQPVRLALSTACARC